MPQTMLLLGVEEKVQAGSTPHGTMLPLGLAPESCCLCPLGRQDPLTSLLPGQDEGMLPPCPNRVRAPFGQGGSIPSSIDSLQTRPGCPRWDGLSCQGSTSPMKNLAPDARAGLPALGKQQAGPAFHGHSLLSLPGQVPGAPAAPGRSCDKDQPFPGVPGTWMRSQRCWWAEWWGCDGPGSLQGGCPSPCPCTAAGQGAAMQGDSGVPQRGGSQAGGRSVMGEALREDLGVQWLGPSVAALPSSSICWEC